MEFDQILQMHLYWQHVGWDKSIFFTLNILTNIDWHITFSLFCHNFGDMLCAGVHVLSKLYLLPRFIDTATKYKYGSQWLQPWPRRQTRTLISTTGIWHFVQAYKTSEKMLIRLGGCAGWSASLLVAYDINRFSHDVALLFQLIMSISWMNLSVQMNVMTMREWRAYSLVRWNNWTTTALNQTRSSTWLYWTWPEPDLIYSTVILSLR